MHKTQTIVFYNILNTNVLETSLLLSDWSHIPGIIAFNLTNYEDSHLNFS